MKDSWSYFSWRPQYAVSTIKTFLSFLVFLKWLCGYGSHQALERLRILLFPRGSTHYVQQRAASGTARDRSKYMFAGLYCIPLRHTDPKASRILGYQNTYGCRQNIRSCIQYLFDFSTGIGDKLSHVEFVTHVIAFSF